MLIISVAGGVVFFAGVAFLRAGVVRLPRVIVPAAMAVGAVGTALGGASPTGWILLDVVLVGAVGAGVPWAASRTGGWAATWVALVAALAAGVSGSGPEVAVGVALGIQLGSLLSGTASPEVRAAVTAVGVATLGNLEWEAVTGASGVATAVAAVPVLMAGARSTQGRARRRLGLAVLGACVLVAVGAAVGLLAALGARSDVDAAVDLAVDGLDRLGDDDEEATKRLARAASRFDAAEDSMRAWWARPALLVPVVSQQSRAVSTMASTGAELARAAIDTAGEADVDAVRPQDGRVDLDALRELAGPLDEAAEALEDASSELADVDSPLLLWLVDDRLDTLSDKVDGALETAALASEAVELAPQLLGADGPRRYFLAFQTPSEARGNGGFMGNWGEITAVDGAIELSRTGRVRELSNGGPNPDARRIEGEEDYVARYSQDPAKAWGLINFTPDHPTVGRIVSQLYPQSGGEELDGVIAVTPRAFAAFLELTGPVEVAGYPERLSSGNAERILLHEQYLEFPNAVGEEREQFLTDATEVLFDELTSGRLPGPRVLADELGGAVESRDLQFWSPYDDEQRLFARLGATGSATRAPGDAIGVIGQNFAGNKIDWFLRRALHYDADYDPETGEVDGTITVTFENQAPATGLPRSVIGWGGDPGTGQIPTEDGENLQWVTVFAGAPIQAVLLDGESVDHEVSGELGHHSARLFVSIPAGTTRTLEVRVRGVALTPGDYRLDVVRQPTVEPDVVTADIRIPAGWVVDEVLGAGRRAGSTVGDDTGDETRHGGVVLETTVATPVNVELRLSEERSGVFGLIDTLREG